MLTKSMVRWPGWGGPLKCEVEQLLRDLREASTDVATLGQYLQPTRRNLRVAEYVTHIVSSLICVSGLRAIHRI